jgi:hypothetical protein
MSEHYIEIEFNNGVYSTLICKAKENSFCHAYLDCDCEQVSIDFDDDDVPYHMYEIENEQGEVEEVKHTGGYRKLCFHQECFESDEFLVGGLTVQFPVEPIWDGDWYEYKVEDKND